EAHAAEGETCWLLALLLRPVAIVIEVLENSVLDEHDLLGRTTVTGDAAADIVCWIGNESNALVSDFHSDLVSATRLGEERSPFVRRAGLRGEGDDRDEISDSCRKSHPD